MVAAGNMVQLLNDNMDVVEKYFISNWGGEVSGMIFPYLPKGIDCQSGYQFGRSL